MLLPLLAIVGLSSPSVTGLACLFEIDRIRRPRNATYVVLRATPDSASDGGYFEIVPGRSIAISRTRTLEDQRPREVFGQVFELVAAEGPAAAALLAHRRVVVVWWTYDTSCGRQAPMGSVAPIDELFLATEARPRHAWIDGQPTFDAGLPEWSYAPARQTDAGVQAQNARGMKVAEYVELYTRLPFAGDSTPEYLAAMRRIIAWGDDAPDRWSIAAAIGALCHASWVLEERDSAGRPCPQGRRAP